MVQYLLSQEGDTSDGLAGSSARSVVRRDAGPSQGPRDESVRACKAARRVAFRGHWRASAPLDDVETSPTRRFLPGGREKMIICITLL